MNMIAELSPAEWLDETEKKIAGVRALTQLVDGPTPGQPAPVTDPRAWIHTDFHTFRMGMHDNDPSLPRLARIEQDFVAAIGALNFGGQMRQLRQAMNATQLFHFTRRSGFMEHQNALRVSSHFLSELWGEGE